jgi:hypothetical protein
MGALDQRTMEIMAAFQRYEKSGDISEVASIKLEELRHTDVRLGNRDIDAGFRIALRNRIRELESLSEKKYQSWVRAVGYIVAFALSVLSTMVVNWLGK